MEDLRGEKNITYQTVNEKQHIVKTFVTRHFILCLHYILCLIRGVECLDMRARLSISAST